MFFYVLINTDLIPDTTYKKTNYSQEIWKQKDVISAAKRKIQNLQKAWDDTNEVRRKRIFELIWDIQNLCGYRDVGKFIPVLKNEWNPSTLKYLEKLNWRPFKNYGFILVKPWIDYAFKIKADCFISLNIFVSSKDGVFFSVFTDIKI